MRRIARHVSLPIAALSLLVGSSVLAAPLYIEAKVTAVSSAGADVDAASGQATQEALLNALRLFTQKQLDPRTWQAKRPTVELFLRTKGFAYVAFSRLEKRRIEGGTTIRVWMTVGLKEEALKVALLKTLTRPNTVVVCVQPVDEATDVRAGAAETQVAEALLASGSDLVSRTQMDESRWQDYLRTLSRGEYLAAPALGLGFLADVAVRVRLSARRSQDNQGIISGGASADVEGVDTHTARVLFSTHLGPQTGFGLDLPRALDDACSKIAAQAAEYVRGQIAAHRQRCVRSIRVISSDALTADKWAKLAENLRRAPLIKEVQVADGALTCLVEGGTLDIAVAVESVGGHRVMSLSEDTVRITR